MSQQQPKKGRGGSIPPISSPSKANKFDQKKASMFSPESIQQFSDIEEDDDDQSIFSDNKSSYKKD